MGKNNKKGPNKGNAGNVFKVAGAKSLKKTKAKAVNLSLKNMKQKVQDIDAQFLEISKAPKPAQKPARKEKQVKQQKKAAASKEDVAKTVEKIVKMDI